MVNMAEAVAVLFPAARPLRDYRVESDPTGERIAHWDDASLGPSPTPEQLAAVTDADVAATRIARVRTAAGDALDTRQDDPILLQRAIFLEMIDAINRTRAQHNALLQWLNGQTTLTGRAQLANFQLGQPTPAQARQAVKDRLAAGEAD